MLCDKLNYKYVTLYNRIECDIVADRCHAEWRHALLLQEPPPGV